MGPKKWTFTARVVVYDRENCPDGSPPQVVLFLSSTKKDGGFAPICVGNYENIESAENAAQQLRHDLGIVDIADCPACGDDAWLRFTKNEAGQFFCECACGAFSPMSSPLLARALEGWNNWARGFQRFDELGATQ